MKFKQLSIVNFLTIGSATVYLDDRGLNVIQGVNGDDTSAKSNGAGKSSIVDALCWALYGVTARGAKGDGIVNRKAGKNTSVTVHIQIGELVYIVTRYRKHKEHKNQLHITSPTGERLDRGTEAESQKVLDKILGCSYEVFTVAVYSGQEILPDLPKMTDRELKRLIEEGAGMQRIEAAYIEARGRYQEASSKHGEATASLVMAKTSLAGAETLVLEVRNKVEEWHIGREGRIQDARNKRDHAVNALDEAVSECAVAESKITAADRARVTKLKEQLAQHATLNAEWQRLQRVAVDAEKAIKRPQLEAAIKRIRTIEKDIAEAGEHIGKPCVECGKPHTEADKELYVQAKNLALTEAREEAMTIKRQVELQVAVWRLAVEAADEAKKVVPDVSAVTAELNKFAALEKGITEAKAKVALREKDAQAAEAAVAVVIAAVCPHSASLELAVRQLKEWQDKVRGIEDRLVVLAEQLEVAQAVTKVFGPAGVRAHILDTVTPYLNEQTATYLTILSDGSLTATWTTLTKDSKGDLKEKFSIDVSSAAGVDDFVNLSGGEKRKVRLACALALQDLVASRAVKPIDCWIGDEVDDALDRAGLERLMIILEIRARQRGTVVVISHNDLTDWCDLITTVEKKEGVSVVDGALCE